MVYLQKNRYLFLFFTIPLFSSDKEESEFHKTQLVSLVGCHNADKIPTITVYKKAYELYKSIFALPSDIRDFIIKQSVFYDAYQWAYLKSFKKANNIVTKNCLHGLTALSSLSEDTIAITQPEAFIEVWSLKKREQKFKSNQLASIANCYKAPLLMSGSPDTYLYTWNTDSNYTHNAIKTEHPTYISLLFPSCSSYIISCDGNGIISTHNSDNLTTKSTILNAHEGAIYSGKPVTTNTFITGGEDSCVKEWDTNLDKPISAYQLPSNFIPYGIHALDERYIIIGGSQQIIYVLERRMNLILKKEYQKSKTFDMAALKDNTIIFGDTTIHFETWDGNTLIKKNKLPTESTIMAIITGDKDTVVWADKDSRVSYIKPTGRPYHLTGDASFEQAILASNIDYENADL